MVNPISKTVKLGQFFYVESDSKLCIDACLLQLFKQQFSLFKQHYTYFYTLFHLHEFPKNTNNITRNLLPNRQMPWHCSSLVNIQPN